MPDLIFNLSKSNVVYLSNENINLAIWEYFSLSSYFSTYCYYLKRILRNCLLGSQMRYKHTHSFVLLWYTHTTLNSEFVWIKIYYCYHIILLKQLSIALYSSSVQFSSVTQSCPTICDPMDCSTPGLPVHHQILELIQTHVHWVGHAIQPSHTLSPPSPPAFNLSQHQGLFKRVSSLHQVAKVLEFQLQRQPFQCIFRTDFL